MPRNTLNSLIICLFLVTILISGCSEKEIKVTPKLIGELIFKDFASVTADLESGFWELNSKEISLLEKAIKNGDRLIELKTNDTPDDDRIGHLQIIIDKQKHLPRVDLYFNHKEGYILVSKIQIYGDKVEEYRKRFDLYEKYLNGLYKFYPSKKEINELVNSILKDTE